MAQGIEDLVNTLKNILRVCSGVLEALQNVFPRAYGTFTLTATPTFVISTTQIKAGAVVILTPTNASAATLMSGSKSLYVDTAVTVAGASFTVKTADATNATAGATFNYIIVNPV